jgi:hypothetical protein
MRFNLDNYETVESRLAKFWEQYPNGQVFTQIHHYDENRVVFRAEVYKDISDPRPVATGYAEETRDASPVNRTSHVENAETSAIGRALANYIFQSKTAPRPSREEMEKVARAEGDQPSSMPKSEQVMAMNAVTKIFPTAREVEAKPQRRPQVNPNNAGQPASKAQVGKIVALSMAQNYSKEERLKIASDVAGRPVNDLAHLKMSEASEMIQLLSGAK